MFKEKCKVHGLTDHKLQSNGANRPKRSICVACLRARQKKVHRTKKRAMVKRLGNKCVLCGYSKWLASLDFHHIDPSQKSKNLTKLCRSGSLELCIEETDKCALVCKNCHGELETGCPETIIKFEKWLKNQVPSIGVEPIL